MGGGVRLPAILAEGRGYIPSMPLLLAEKQCAFMNNLASPPARPLVSALIEDTVCFCILLSLLESSGPSMALAMTDVPIAAVAISAVAATVLFPCNSATIPA